MLERRLMLAQTTGLFFNNPGSYNGYVLFSPNTTNTTYLINKAGTVVHQWTSSYTPGLLGYLLPDGSLLRDAAVHGQGGNGSIQAAGAGGLLERFDWNGTKTWEFAYDSPTHLAHHDFEVMPNGNILLIAWELKSETEATQAGRDPNLAGAGYLYPDSIVEVHPDLINGGGTIVWEWHVWDHLVQQFDNSKSNYLGATGVTDHPELIDINYVSDPNNGGGQREDWTHANGIDYNPQLDQIVLSVREFSEFWIIDHSTTTAEAAGHTGGQHGKGGDLLYRWGNPETYKRGTANDRLLFFQHDPQWIPAGVPGTGNITVFNNGFGRPGADFSQVVEMTPPVDVNGNYPSLAPAAIYGPAAATWTYDTPPDKVSPIISGAQRLPNGNTIVDFGVRGEFSEVTSAGVEVWKYVNPYTGGGTLGPNDPIPSLGFSDPLLGSLRTNFTFQAIEYPMSYVTQLPSAVVGTNLFYKDSTKWNVTNGATFSDDNAIAPDKTAYLPGSGTSTFSSVSSYDKGINGLMVDLAGAHGAITINDFQFKRGNNNSPNAWATASGPTTVTTRASAGGGGADRVELLWDNNQSVKKEWLEVIVEGNDTVGGFNTNTGLASSYVFYFGNPISDTGTGNAGAFQVTSSDEVNARNNPKTFTATRSDVNDFNRDGSVNSTDQIIARNNGTNLGNQLKFLVVGAGGPFAPVAAEPASNSRNRADDSMIASAITVATASASSPPSAGGQSNAAGPSSVAMTAYFASLADNVGGAESELPEASESETLAAEELFDLIAQPLNSD
jgi:hypothetical protein